MSDEWPNENYNNFQKYTKTDSKFMCSWVMFGNIPPGRLSHALEYLGHAEDNVDEVKNTLRFFLKHPSPVVREGALYGLQRMSFEEKDIDYLYEMAKNDSSPGIKELAQEMVDEFWEESFEYEAVSFTKEEVENFHKEIMNGNQGDGGHHKNYHFDQLARKLLKKNYWKWRLHFEYGDTDDGEKIYEWDEGIPG